MTAPEIAGRLDVFGALAGIAADGRVLDEQQDDPTPPSPEGAR
ncbi:hypothetical protein [Rhodococcus sp. H29-C3]|nr:hypothetical protein [Rhodococcus sp. H29-C3]MDJ0363120.1 hypothetical protein [Rhodococcus sp. H29-C3]